MLKAVACSMPGVAVFTNFYYLHPCQAFLDKYFVSSESGMQQGDSLGLLHFSLTLWHIIEKIQESSPSLQQHSWCLYDGVLVGSEDNVFRSWYLLCKLGSDLGLPVRVDKCEFWSTRDLERLDLRKKRNDYPGLEVLGAAVGSTEFVCTKLNEKIGKIRVLFQNLDYFDDPQCSLGILIHRIGVPKMVKSLCCQTPTSPIIKSAKEIESVKDKVQKTIYF